MRSLSYKMPQSKFLVTLAGLYGRAWGVGLGVAIMICGGLAVIGGWRWCVVALMLVFLIAPMLMAYLYFAYALRPEIFFNPQMHTAEVADGKLNIHIALRPDKVEDDKSTEEGSEPEWRSVSFALSEIGQYSVGMDSVRIPIGNKGWLWLPKRAFPDDRHFRQFLKSLYKDIDKYFGLKTER